MRIDRNVEMEMRDGTLLRADIYRPDGMEKHPAILTRFYRKTWWPRRTNWLDAIDVVDAGYALVTQDTRGKGASDGDWSMDMASEGTDGYDSIEWIAGQSWCDGNVGMMGYSHGGAMTWQAAMENPPHLKAIAPWSAGGPAGRSGGVPPLAGGANQFMNTLNFMTNESGDVIDRMEINGEDVTELRRIFEWAQNEVEEYINFLPLKDMPFARYEKIGRLWDMRLHPRPRSEQESLKRFEKVTVPGLYVTGWYDIGNFAVFEGFRNMRNHGGSQLCRENQYIIIGPWQHGDELISRLAGINFGASAVGPERNILTERLITFYDRILRGKDIKIPPIQYFVMSRNRWQFADTWPLPETQFQRYYLHSKGRANTSTGDGILSRNEPGSEQPDMYIYNPLFPVPTSGGPMTSPVPGFGLVPGPMEQSYIEQRNDVLCYTTTEFQEDVEVTGPLQIHVFASTSTRDTDFTARLLDVYPDGRSHNVAEGIIRASGRKSEVHPEPVTPGEINEYVIGMGNTSQVFRKGHRIRIDISSSNFPLYDRNMNTGNPIGEDTTGIPAVQTIYHQSEYVSYIDLPIIPS